MEKKSKPLETGSASDESEDDIQKRQCKNGSPYAREFVANISGYMKN